MCDGLRGLLCNLAESLCQLGGGDPAAGGAADDGGEPIDESVEVGIGLYKDFQQRVLRHCLTAVAQMEAEIDEEESELESEMESDED